MIYKSSVRTSQETRHVSATKPNRLMLFIVRIIWNTQIHCVGRIQSIFMLMHVVNIVASVLLGVQSDRNIAYGEI
jgi:hypothetical protein